MGGEDLKCTVHFQKWPLGFLSIFVFSLFVIFFNNVFNNSFVHFELIFVIESDKYLNFQKDGCRLQRWICAVVQINI